MKRGRVINWTFGGQLNRAARLDVSKRRSRRRRLAIDGERAKLSALFHVHGAAGLEVATELKACVEIFARWIVRAVCVEIALADVHAILTAAGCLRSGHAEVSICIKRNIDADGAAWRNARTWLRVRERDGTKRAAHTAHFGIAGLRISGRHDHARQRASLCADVGIVAVHVALCA